MSGNLAKSGGALDANAAADPAVAAAPVVAPESGLNGTASPPFAAAGACWRGAEAWLGTLAGCAAPGAAADEEPGAADPAGGQGAVLAASGVFFLLKAAPRFLNAAFVFAAASLTVVGAAALLFAPPADVFAASGVGQGCDWDWVCAETAGQKAKPTNRTPNKISVEP